MANKTLFASFVVLSLAFAPGCRGDDDGGGGGDGGPTIDGGSDDVAIYDIQDSAMPAGTAVTMRGVVVTAIDAFGGRTGGVYVEEPAGGAYSGVFVFLSGSAAAGLAVGDLVDVEGGVKDEFTLEMGTCMRSSDCTLTEVSAPQNGSITITKVGSGTVPDPEVLNPWDLAADDSEAEKWEGVLIKFDNVRSFDQPYGVSSSDTTLKEMGITGPFLASSSLTDLPDTIMDGDCFSEMVGIGDYFFNYKLLPRSAADMTVAATDTCLAPEDQMSLCDDQMDNDYNGFADCEDFGCQELPMSACVVTSTISNIQMNIGGSLPDNSKVLIENVVITAVETQGSGAMKRFYVQDQVTAGPYTGVYVYQPSSATNLTVGVDDRVDILANAKNYTCSSCSNPLTELDNVTSITKVNGPSGTTAILDGISVADLSTMQQYEGVVVRLTNVAVVDEPMASCTFCDFSVGDNTNKLWVGDRVFKYTPTAAECLAELIGVMTYDTFNDRIQIQAMSVTTGGTCN